MFKSDFISHNIFFLSSCGESEIDLKNSCHDSEMDKMEYALLLVKGQKSYSNSFRQTAEFSDHGHGENREISDYRHSGLRNSKGYWKFSFLFRFLSHPLCFVSSSQVYFSVLPSFSSISDKTFHKSCKTL